MNNCAICGDCDEVVTHEIVMGSLALCPQHYLNALYESTAIPSYWKFIVVRELGFLSEFQNIWIDRSDQLLATIQ